MATETRRKKASKSESLTIRLDPKMRFALDFVARVKGQTITKVVESSILEKADNVEISDDFGGEYNWKSFWDVNEGVRFINRANKSFTNPSFEDEELLDFIKTHWNYFSKKPDLSESNLRRSNIEILWPEIERLNELWLETKASNRTSCAEEMRKILQKASLTSASWSVSYEYESLLVDSNDAEIPI